MFTQCSKCETIFKLSAEVLRTAGGQVRCGRCGEVFNALARLAEDPGTFTVGESPLELEARADQILGAGADPPPRPRKDAEPFEAIETPGVQIARLEVQGWEQPAAEAGTSLEYTLPPDDLDRIFVEPKPPPKKPAGGDAAAPAGAGLAALGMEVSESARREFLELFNGPEKAPPPLIDEPRPGAALWFALAAVLLVLLVAQVVHRNREALAAHEPWGAALRTVYANLGAPLPTPASLAGYQLRQWGVTGDPGANGTLRVRASILNTTAQLQPYPLLRVTLADRFGNHMGMRDFEPAEYLGKPTTRMLAPGERVDATMEILDPGKSAEGFEIDVCLRNAERRVRCANDAAAHPR